MHVYVRMRVWIHVEVRGWHHVPPSIAPHRFTFLFWDNVSTEPGTPCLSDKESAGDLNSGPNAYVTGPLTTKPSPKSCIPFLSPTDKIGHCLWNKDMKFDFSNLIWI